ncbi:MAG TPA: hypothetical protein VJ842_11170 [Pyrinomonadaceae bacterium]|nr:hypothetical protein [Pyrinomonadaceae bacterium]
MKHLTRLFAAMTMMLFLSGLAFAQSRYTQFGNINNGSVNVGSAWTKLNTTSTTHTFNKVSSSTKIEVIVNSRFRVGTISAANGVKFQVRIDNTVMPTFGNQGSILTSNTSEFLSIFTVFSTISAGNHTVSIWAQAPSGSATSVLADPGGWGGMIVVKETP